MSQQYVNADLPNETVAHKPRAVNPASFLTGCFTGICVLTLCGGLVFSSAATAIFNERPDLAQTIASLGTREPVAASIATPESESASEPTGTAAAGTEEPGSTELPTEEPEFQRSVWKQVWTTVDEEYAYADFNGVDWRARREAIDKRIADGMSRDDFYEAIGDEITALNDDHSGFDSPKWANFYGLREGYGSGIALAVNARTKSMHVLSVDSGSPAERAGIRPHMRVLSVNGTPTVTADGSEGDFKFDYDPDGSNTLVVAMPGTAKQTVKFTIHRYAIADDAHSARLLPRAKTNGKKIGYVFVPTFSGSFSAASFAANLEKLMREGGGALDGLIVDVRVNSGGSEWVLQRVFATLSTKDTIGINKSRDGKERLLGLEGMSDPVGNSHQVPVAVLIGPNTISAAEIFAGCLKAQYPDRVTLVGERSAGNLEAVQTFEIDDGSSLALAVETFHRPDGSTWEREGLTPDIAVASGWDEVTDSRDAVVDAAVQALNDAAK